jgi:ring-1,2-phenylacetyl-CoA epoxidase subunit PaaC
MALLQYVLRLADNALISGHRLSEWCSKGPTLETDMALTNVALDHIGQARLFYQYAALLENKGHTEDDLAYLREEHEFQNFLLTELPNGDFGMSMVRMFLMAAFQHPFYEALTQSSDATLSGIAEKAVKETAYHRRWSGEWVVRLGDGTEESHQRAQNALNALWPYCGELRTPDALDTEMWQAGISPHPEAIAVTWDMTVRSVLQEATLSIPNVDFYQKGGKRGKHTEHLGYILAEMQYLQRVHPGATW